MIKQLQSKIIRLEQTVQGKQRDFMKKKQNYEKIIQELQNQNEELQNLIKEMNDLHRQKSCQSQSLNAIDCQQDQLSDYQIKQAQNPSYQNNQFQELIRENNYLKQQISTISVTYQRQIEQLTMYFQKIKLSSKLSHANNRNSPGNSREAGKVSILINAYENLLKFTDSERLKFQQKINELYRYLTLSQNKNNQLCQQLTEIRRQLKLNEQNMRLFKKNLRF